MDGMNIRYYLSECLSKCTVPVTVFKRYSYEHEVKVSKDLNFTVLVGDETELALNPDPNPTRFDITEFTGFRKFKFGGVKFRKTSLQSSLVSACPSC